MVTTKSFPELRVLQVFGHLGLGGAETWLLQILRYFNEHREELGANTHFDILLTSGEPGMLDAEAKKHGARLVYLPYSRRSVRRFIFGFRELLRLNAYDAIHDHQDLTAGLHFLMGVRRLPPVRAVHFHNSIAMRSRYAVGPVREAAGLVGRAGVLGLATHLLGTSYETLREYRLTPGTVPTGVRSSVLHCGFDVRPFANGTYAAHRDLRVKLQWPGESRIILFVGRLHTDARFNQKNPAFALDVATDAMRLDPRLRLVFVGDGEEGRRELEKRASDYGVAERTAFLGVRRDVASLMLGSDLLLFPSLSEALGMIAVEAQASGLPVLAADTVPRECVVCADLVRFLPLNATREEWAQSIVEMAEMPRDVARGNAAVAASAFSIEQSARALFGVYRAGGSCL